MLLHAILRIRHSNTDTGIFNHTDIVVRIADAHDFLRLNAVAGSNAFYCLPLVNARLHQLQKVVLRAGNIQFALKLCRKLLPNVAELLSARHHENLIRCFVRMVQVFTDCSRLDAADFGIHLGESIFFLN